MSKSHFPPSLGQQTLNHHTDTSILSISHSPASSIEAAPGANNFTHPGPQRKFTLLARPQQQQLSSSTSISSYQHTITSPDLNSVSCLNQPTLIQSPGSVPGIQPTVPVPGIQPTVPVPGIQPSGPVIQPSGPVPGRAARDDYYDTEDPSVNLHEFIVNSMQAQKNRVVLVKLEEEFVSYVSDLTRTEPLKLPPWDSYHRMLAHRVAAYFGLEHNVDPMDKTRVIVGKGPNTRLPQIRFGDYLSLNDDSESPEPKLILKRTSKDTTAMAKFEAALASLDTSPDVKVLKSYEEREEEYEKARAQIFNQQSPLQSSHTILPFDLASSSSQRMSSSLFPSVMHHRRAASDTAMFKRAVAADLKKELSSSSNHSSRSATPLISSYLRPAGSCELLSSSINQQVQPPPLQHQTSPKAAQQQLHTSVLESQGQASQFHSQNPVSSNSNSPSIYSTDRTQSQLSGGQVSTTTTAPPASIHYQQAHTSVPMLYPHPTTALLTDPNWYPYQQMMLYQIPPQGYVPTAAHYVGGGSPHMIPGALYHPYSVTPGVIGQHQLISPPVTTHPQHLTHPGSVGAVARLPIGVDQLSPSHPNSGVALVRPVPQQASQLTKLDGTWNFPSTPQFNMQQSMMAQQMVNPNSGQPAFATVLPITQQVSASSHLAEQLENTLHITTPRDTDADITPQREPPKSSMNSKVKLMSYTEAGRSVDGSEVDSGYMGHIVSRLPGNGPFPVGNMPIGEHTLFGGQMISPTHPPGPVQYMQHQMQPPPLYGGTGQEGSGYVNSQGILPSSAIQYPTGNPSQPSTPTIGPLNLAPPGILQAQQQGIFSPPSTGLTRNHVQILGHSLGTSLFSPPPSSGNQHALLVNSPTSSGKVGFSPGTPNHPPVGSGTRFRHFDSPKQSGSHVSEISASMSSQSGYQSLPPRLAQQQGQKSGNRYQNQRHPSNRVSFKGNNGPVTLGDHLPTQLVIGGNSTVNRREPLLPTPPSTQMVKLDTNLTCGVPLNIMEVVGYPPEGAPERMQAYKAVMKLNGVQDVINGKMIKTGEEVTIAVFDCQDTATQALQMKHVHFSLSIPRNNHAKFIMTMLPM